MYRLVMISNIKLLAVLNRFYRYLTSPSYHNSNGAKQWLEEESKLIIFGNLRKQLLFSKNQKENKICTMDDVWGDFIFSEHPKNTKIQNCPKKKSALPIDVSRKFQSTPLGLNQTNIKEMQVSFFIWLRYRSRYIMPTGSLP